MLFCSIFSSFYGYINESTTDSSRSIANKQEMIFCETKRFGQAEWNKHLGEVGTVPLVPTVIEEALEGICPFWPDRKVKETHMLVLIPKILDGKVLTVGKLDGHYIDWESYIGEGEDRSSINSSYWILMTKRVIPGSLNKSWTDQIALVKEYNYRVPTVMEAAICILGAYLESNVKLYSGEGCYTHCRETQGGWPIAVGKSSKERDLVIEFNDYTQGNGVGGVKIF